MAAIAALASGFGAARQNCRAFFAWWWGELAGMLPAGVRQVLSPSSRWLFIDLDLDGGGARISDDAGQPLWQGQESGEPPRLLKHKADRAARRRKLAVRLAPSGALMRRLDLPSAAAANLRQVLRFELDRQTPFTEDQVYFDGAIVSRDDARQRITVELALAERHVVDRVLAISRRWGVSFDRIGPAGTTHANLLRGLDGGAGEGSRVHLSAFFALATLVLLAIWVGLKLARLDDAVAVANAQVAKARAEALLVEKLGRDADALELQASFLGRSLPVARLRVLHEVTRLLPDDVWLHQFQVIEREVRIAGTAPNAASLVSALESSPLFRNVRFRAPITKAGGAALDRFELSFDLRPEASS